MYSLSYCSKPVKLSFFSWRNMKFWWLCWSIFSKQLQLMGTKASKCIKRYHKSSPYNFFRSHLRALWEKSHWSLTVFLFVGISESAENFKKQNSPVYERIIQTDIMKIFDSKEWFSHKCIAFMIEPRKVRRDFRCMTNFLHFCLSQKHRRNTMDYFYDTFTNYLCPFFKVKSLDPNPLGFCKQTKKFGNCFNSTLRKKKNQRDQRKSKKKKEWSKQGARFDKIF